MGEGWRNFGVIEGMVCSKDRLRSFGVLRTPQDDKRKIRWFKVW